MTVKCKKRAYRDEIKAKLALASCARCGRDEVRCYRCPDCHAWHLTKRK